MSGRSGSHEANSCAVSYAPVSTTRSTSGWEISVLPASPSTASTSCSTSRGTPASHSASHTAVEQRRDSGDGLWITAEPVASGATVVPVGMASGKFHGGVTTVTACGTKSPPSTNSSSSARRA